MSCMISWQEWFFFPKDRACVTHRFYWLYRSGTKVIGQRSRRIPDLPAVSSSAYAAAFDFVGGALCAALLLWSSEADDSALFSCGNATG